MRGFYKPTLLRRLALHQVCMQRGYLHGRPTLPRGEEKHSVTMQVSVGEEAGPDPAAPRNCWRASAFWDKAFCSKPHQNLYQPQVEMASGMHSKVVSVGLVCILKGRRLFVMDPRKGKVGMIGNAEVVLFFHQKSMREKQK